MYLHLSRLKARILPPELVAQTRYDARLASLAAGVADAFDRATGRVLRRGSMIEERPGGATLYSLARYPVESLTSATITVGVDGTPSPVEIARLSKSAGLVRLRSPEGSPEDTLTFSYTGGYFIDLSEAGSGTLPEGAAALPADLLDAWCLQCDHEARMRKIFGGASAEDAKNLPKDYDFIPRVDRVLRGYMKLV